ncbi:MAG: ABC transporter ATP-binding protein, partial [Oscillospiraceae bacterium]
MALFQIKDLNFAYPESKVKALDNINIEINTGEFVSICGRSGCGKSTLLRHLKPVLTPYGKRAGEIIFDGVEISKIEPKQQAQRIGYVLQNPDNQVVTDKVWHELAFGLESLGYDNLTIRLRVAEMASFFGIEKWFMKNVAELSGGQRQLLNLASIMALQPDVLILDEPTSQLDPIAASDFLETVRKINREIGTTVIIVEHRLEDTLPYSDRAIVMDNGSIIIDDTPKNVGERLKQQSHDMFLSMPAPMRIYSAINNKLECP